MENINQEPGDQGLGRAQVKTIAEEWKSASQQERRGLTKARRPWSHSDRRESSRRKGILPGIKHWRKETEQTAWLPVLWKSAC